MAVYLAEDKMYADFRSELHDAARRLNINDDHYVNVPIPYYSLTGLQITYAQRDSMIIDARTGEGFALLEQCLKGWNRFDQTDQYRS